MNQSNTRSKQALNNTAVLVNKEEIKVLDGVQQKEKRRKRQLNQLLYAQQQQQ